MSVLEKCSKCGGTVFYSPENKGLKCDKCASITEIKFDNTYELREIDPTATNDIKLRHFGVLKCSSCGASISNKKSNMATECQYCGANVIEEMDFENGLVPNAVFPFEISKEKAKVDFISWVKGKPFVKKDFKKKVKDCEIESMYIPVFEYDMYCDSDYKARLYEIDRDSDGNSTKSYKNVSGVINTRNKNISVECSNYINDYRLNDLKPFWTDKLYRFDKTFVLGYSVEHPNIDVMKGRDIAKKYNEQKINSRIVEKHGCSGYDYINKDVKYNTIKHKYLLYPIHRLKVDYNGNTSYAYMNGQSGKKNGSLPISVWKVVLVVLGGIGLLCAGVLLSFLFGGSF